MHHQYKLANRPRMYTWVFMLLLSATGLSRAQPSQHPNVTTCEEFERGAEFDPYVMVDSLWKIFYFWANHTELYPIMFSLPARKRLLKMKELMDSIEPYLEIEWDKATLIMTPRPGIEVLFLYLGTPGAFRALVMKEQRDKVRPYPEPLIKFADVRMKLVEDQRYMGMMCCEDYTAFALARRDDVPTTEKGCQARPSRKPISTLIDLRLKHVAGIRYVIMMDCNRSTAYLFARIYDMPQSDEQCAQAAELAGHHGLGGQCYLELLTPQEKDEL